MADTIGTSQAQYFIPEIWGNYALPILRSVIATSPRVLKDTDVASFSVGNVLHVPYPGTLAVEDKTAGAEYTLSQPASSGEVQVTLDHHKAVTINVEDIVRAQASYDVMDIYARAQVISLAEQIESDVIAGIVAGAKLERDGSTPRTKSTIGTAGTALSATAMQTAWKAMTDNKAPQLERTAVISTKDWQALLADTALQTYFAFTRTTAISAADLGLLYGFQTFASQLVPSMAGTPTEYDNIAFTRDGVMLAMRGLPEPPPGSMASRYTVRDDVSGLVLSVLMGYDVRRGGVQVVFEALYGVKVLEPAKVLLIKS
jgi:hypothetical protein